MAPRSKCRLIVGPSAARPPPACKIDFAQKRKRFRAAPRNNSRLHRGRPAEPLKPLEKDTRMYVSARPRQPQTGPKRHEKHNADDYCGHRLLRPGPGPRHQGDHRETDGEQPAVPGQGSVADARRRRVLPQGEVGTRPVADLEHPRRGEDDPRPPRRAGRPQPGELDRRGDGQARQIDTRQGHGHHPAGFRHPVHGQFPLREGQPGHLPPARHDRPQRHDPPRRTSPSEQRQAVRKSLGAPDGKDRHLRPDELHRRPPYIPQAGLARGRGAEEDAPGENRHTLRPAVGSARADLVDPPDHLFLHSRQGAGEIDRGGRLCQRDRSSTSVRRP